MSLAPGQSLSHYEVLGPLGAGAMGEVYRAKDTRLGREVAIKVLPAHFAEEAERMARFEREARSVATLNHPNIAQIYGVDQDQGLYFLALELVPGQTLEERLERGPLPVDEALDVGRQIAEGLEAAHEAGVIHRDLKPANVRLTPEGKVKLLDFGLAKSTGPGGARESSTDSVLSTEAGRLLGTPTYMAPEQARGRAIDRRVDIWAFGCVLYECLTARRAFAGETLTDVLGAVLHTEPDLDALPAGTPARVRELLADCLVKDPHGRARDAGEIRRQLERALRGSGSWGVATDGAWTGAATAAGTGGARGGARRVGLPILAVVAVLGVAAGFALDRGVSQLPAAPDTPVLRADLTLPSGFEVAFTEHPISLSPDGRRLVVVGTQDDGPSMLWVRPLDSTRLQPLAGTEGALYPFWSPDGEELGFFADEKLKRMRASGGGISTVCPSTSSRGGTWGPNGDLVFAPAPFGPLHRVPATGGTPVPVTETSGRESHRLPHFLPDGRHVLFTVTNTDRNGIHVVDLETGERSFVLDAASDGLYVEPGLLLFVRGSTLMARPFDLEALAVRGQERVVVEDVYFVLYRATGWYHASRGGDVVHAPRTVLRQLQWFDAEGRPQESIGPPAAYELLALSPDGQRVAATIGREGRFTTAWVLDSTTGLGSKVADQVAIGGGGINFADDRTVMYPRKEDSGDHEFRTVLLDLDGGGSEREILGGWGADLSEDGEWLLYGQQVPRTNFDLSARRLDDEDSGFVISATEADERSGRFSKDGRWVVYLSDATGQDELYLRPFPGPGPSQQLTDQGASDILLRWLDDGRVVYLDAHDRSRVWSLSVDVTGPRPVVGTPEPMFGGQSLVEGPAAVTADGTRLLVGVTRRREGRQVVSLIQNGLDDARGGAR